MDMQIRTDIPGTLKRIREAYNYTQAYVADYIKVDITSYGRYEKGTTDIKLADFLKLVQLYKKSPENIFKEFPPKGGKPVIINPVVNYENKMKELDSKIMALEKEAEYLTNQVTTLKDLADTKQKILELLEQKNDKLGETDSLYLEARAG